MAQKRGFAGKEGGDLFQGEGGGGGSILDKK